MYSSTLPSTSALYGSGWSTPRPGRFTPGKETRYPLYRRMGGPQGRSARLRKISTPTGLRSPDRSVLSESLYRLSYPGPRIITRLLWKAVGISGLILCWFRNNSVSCSVHLSKDLITQYDRRYVIDMAAARNSDIRICKFVVHPTTIANAN